MTAAPFPKVGDDEQGLHAHLAEAHAALERAIAEQPRLEQAAAQGEQRRLAQTLHDTVSQSLTAVYLQTLVLARTLQKSGSEASIQVSGLADSLHLVVTELREISRQLQPPPDDVPDEG